MIRRGDLVAAIKRLRAPDTPENAAYNAGLRRALKKVLAAPAVERKDNHEHHSSGKKGRVYGDVQSSLEESGIEPQG